MIRRAARLALLLWAAPALAQQRGGQPTVVGAATTFVGGLTGVNTITPAPLQQLALWNPGSVSAQTCNSLTVNVPGARPNDAVSVSAPAGELATLSPPGGYVSGNDLVTLQVCNPTAGAISAANGYWKAVLQ